MENRKFDYVFSNPPYQDQKNSAIFHNFQVLGDIISEKSTMIYPADKWMMRSGKGIGLDEFSVKQLNDTSLSSLTVFENANKIFEGIELHGGISIVEKDRTTNNSKKINITTCDFDGLENSLSIPFPGARTISTSNNINDIVQNVLSHHLHAKFLSSILYPTSLYGIGSNFIEKNKNVAISDKNYDGEQDYVRVLANESTGTQGRVKWFWVPYEIIPKKPIVKDKYIIAISTRHAAGYGGRSQQARIFMPNEFFGDSRYAVASFNNLEETKNFFQWMSSDIIRLLILSSSRRIKNFGTNVPLLNSYSKDISEIDFTQNIDEQLMKKYNFNDEQIDFINKTIKTLGSFAMDEKVF